MLLKKMSKICRNRTKYPTKKAKRVLKKFRHIRHLQRREVAVATTRWRSSSKKVIKMRSVFNH
jgi:hypothetical protein